MISPSAEQKVRVMLSMGATAFTRADVENLLTLLASLSQERDECSGQPISAGGLPADGVIYPGDPVHCLHCKLASLSQELERIRAIAYLTPERPGRTWKDACAVAQHDADEAKAELNGSRLLRMEWQARAEKAEQELERIRTEHEDLLARVDSLRLLEGTGSTASTERR